MSRPDFCTPPDCLDRWEYRECVRRSCATCGPRLIAAKVEPLPDTMFAVEIGRAGWPSLARKLCAWRAHGDAGDFVRIPLDRTRLLIASDAPIGDPIDRTTIHELMLAAVPADGQITASKAWQPRRTDQDRAVRDLEVAP
jgi:hypothetical protein